MVHKCANPKYPSNCCQRTNDIQVSSLTVPWMVKTCKDFMLGLMDGNVLDDHLVGKCETRAIVPQYLITRTLTARRFTAVSPNICQNVLIPILTVPFTLRWFIFSKVAEAAKGPDHLRLLLCFHANSRYLAQLPTSRIQVGLATPSIQKKGRLKIKIEYIEWHKCTCHHVVSLYAKLHTRTLILLVGKFRADGRFPQCLCA